MPETTIGNNTRISGPAVIEEGASIGDHVVIEGDVHIGKNTRVDHGCIIRASVDIGENNWIYPYCVIGTGPQDMSHIERDPGERTSGFGRIEIGDHNIIREHSSIHMPTKTATRIGSNNYIMAQCHVGHDCVVGNDVVMANQVFMGGHAAIEDYANVGFGVGIHQFGRIGRYAMIGMNNSIVKDVLPFSLINRGRFTKINRVGLERRGIARPDIDGIGQMYMEFPKCLELPESGEGRWYVREVASFMERSSRKRYHPDFEGP